MTYTRQQAAKAVADAQAERDAIQANLLDLDNSFGVRLLKGTTLTGVSRQRWDAAAAELSKLWDLFSAYSAVIDQAAEIMSRKAGEVECAEVSRLLTGRSIELVRGQAPLQRRDLADTGRDQLSTSTAREAMRKSFASVADVTAKAEQAWNDVAEELESVGADLARIDPLGDEELTAEVAAVRDELARQRAALNADPLGAARDTAARLAGRAKAAAARAAEISLLVAGAEQRVADLEQAAEAARAAQQDAQAAYQRAAEKIARVPAVIPAVPDVSGRLARARQLRAAGRWTPLGCELDLLERELASAAADCRDTERGMRALLQRRDELRGLLDAYKAKAGRLGAIEDATLGQLYGRARAALWTAPCDLDAAAQAVTSYQQAVLAMGAKRS